MKQYTNEFTADIKAQLNRSPFTEEQLAAMDDDARAVVAEQEAFKRQHPVTAIWRIAIPGSQTRWGGVVLPVEREATMPIEDGTCSNLIVEGDFVAYSDGTLAQITTTAGDVFTWKDRGVALVGSMLDNGDEIVSTPQSCSYLVTREGIPPSENFLTCLGE